MSLRRAFVAGGVAALLAGTVVACSKNTGDAGDGLDNSDQITVGAIGTAEDSKGPALEVPGATPGGKATAFRSVGYEHLDPQRTYYVDAMAAQDMFSRKLTNYKVTADGRMLVVGDLATDPGQDVNKDCKVWKYTLKDNLKYEDGTPITAADVAYGVARSFHPQMAEGPLYLQQWLADSVAYSDVYAGPYDGAALIPPGVTVNGDKEITFTFAKPQCEAPFAMAMPTTTPVPQAKDTKLEYDKKPFSSGPYKIKEYVLGSHLTLDKNPNWDAASDPIRHQYLDEFTIKFGDNIKTNSERLIADQGDDQYAFDLSNVDTSLTADVMSDPEIAKRTVQGENIFVTWLGIDNTKVTDVNVRKALQYAIDKEALLKLFGGPTFGTPAKTTLSPTAIGYNPYDAYPQAVTGDKAKAKELLAGKVTTMKLAYRNSEIGQRLAPFLKEQFKEIGIDLEIIPLDSDTAGDILGRKETQGKYDLFIKNWGADWPTGATVVPVIYDGRTIQDEGNINNIWFSNDAVNAEIDRIRTLPAAEAATAWGELDKTIMTEHSPMVPLYYGNQFSLHGSKLGGLFMNDSLGTLGYTNLFTVK